MGSSEQVVGFEVATIEAKALAEMGLNWEWTRGPWHRALTSHGTRELQADDIVPYLGGFISENLWKIISCKTRAQNRWRVCKPGNSIKHNPMIVLIGFNQVGEIKRSGCRKCMFIMFKAKSPGDLVWVPLLVLRGAKDSNDSNSALFRPSVGLLTDIAVLGNDSSLSDRGT